MILLSNSSRHYLARYALSGHSTKLLPFSKLGLNERGSWSHDVRRILETFDDLGAGATSAGSFENSTQEKDNVKLFRRPVCLANQRQQVWHDPDFPVLYYLVSSNHERLHAYTSWLPDLAFAKAT